MNTGTQKNRRFQGFTLVELTAAAALIALLTAASLVTYAQTWRHWVLRRDAQRFFLAARYARLLAVENGRTYRLVIDPVQKRYSIVQAAENAEPEETVFDLRHRPTRLDDAVSFEHISAAITGTADGQTGITFRPDGKADAALVRLGNGDRGFTIQISAATARASLFADSADGYEPDQIDLDTMQ